MRTLSPNFVAGNSGASNQEQLPEIAHSSVLQAALSGLDVVLDEELERYRQWQSNGQRTSYVSAFRPIATIVTPRVVVTSSDNVIGAKVQTAASPQLPITKSAVPHSEQPVTPSGERTVSNYPTNPAPRTDNRADHYVDTDPSERTQPSALQAALANITASSGDDTSAVNADDLLRDIADNYGEEDIIEESQPSPVSGSDNLLASLLTPLGIASLLLLLLSSAVIGYLLVDPSGLSKLLKPKPNNAKTSYLQDGKGLDPNSVDAQAQQNPLGTENLLADSKNSKIPFVPLPGKSSIPGQSLEGFTAKSNKIKSKDPLPKVIVSSTRPNSTPVLSSPLREVPASNLSYQSLPTFSAPPVVDNSEAPIRSARTSSSYNSVRADSTPRALPPTPPTSYSRPSVSSSPDTIKFAPRSQPTVNNTVSSNSVPVQYAAPVSTNVSSSNSNGYRVIVDNSYVSQAQQVDKEAFVRPSDGNLQLGAYRDPNAAQQRVDQLRRQGIPARLDR